MDRLDVEEVTARVATRAAICAREVEEYLADPPGLYDSAEPSTQKRILQALFERVEVLGPNQLWLVPSAEAEARGLGPLFTGAFRTKVRQSGRGEEGLAPSIPTSVSTSSGSCRIGRDRSFCRLIVRHRDYPCVDHRYRRSRHAPMALSSAPLADGDVEAVVHAVNAFYDGFDLYPRQTPAGLVGSLAPTSLGEVIRQYRRGDRPSTPSRRGSAARAQRAGGAVVPPLPGRAPMRKGQQEGSTPEGSTLLARSARRCRLMSS